MGPQEKIRSRTCALLLGFTSKIQVKRAIFRGKGVSEHLCTWLSQKVFAKPIRLT